ncbi:hypothetical protein ES707_17590 [subsurface metagenome]
MKISRTLIFLIKLAIVLAIVFFIVRAVIADWEKVQSYEWQINPLLLALSCAGFFAAYAVLVLIWKRVLKAFGYTVSYQEAWAIYFIGNLGRYIPGKVWTVVGVAYMAGKSGIPAVVAGTAAICAQAYSVLSSFVFFVIFFILRNSAFTGIRFIWTLFFPVILILIFLVPRNLERMLNLILVRLGRERVSLKLTTAAAMKITCMYLCSWLVYGCAFWLFVSSMTGIGSFNPFFLAGAFAVSYVLGYIAFFAPGGIGVREGILSMLLTGMVSAGVAIVISFSARLMTTCVELICVGAVLIQKGFAYGKEKKKART